VQSVSEYDIHVSRRSGTKETQTATVKLGASMYSALVRKPRHKALTVMPARACFRSATQCVMRHGRSCVRSVSSMARGARDDLEEHVKKRMIGRGKEKLAGTRSKRERDIDHVVIWPASRTMTWTDAEQSEHGESDRVVSSQRRRGRKKETDPRRCAFVFLCPLDVLSPNPLAPAARPAQATHSTSAVVPSHDPAIHRRHAATCRLPYASTIPVPPSSSAVRPAFLVCNSSPQNACAHTRPVSQTAPAFSCRLRAVRLENATWPLAAALHALVHLHPYARVTSRSRRTLMCFLVLIYSSAAL
jgi:hypothetical protein